MAAHVCNRQYDPANIMVIARENDFCQFSDKYQEETQDMVLRSKFER